MVLPHSFDDDLETLKVVRYHFLISQLPQQKLKCSQGIKLQVQSIHRNHNMLLL